MQGAGFERVKAREKGVVRERHLENTVLRQPDMTGVVSVP